MNARLLTTLGIAAVWLAAAAGQGAEAPKINFSGTLIDADTGMAATGVRVSLVDPDEYFAVAGAGGRFTFQNIPVGTYRYMFAYERGDQIPQTTILIAKNVNVTPVAPTNMAFERRLLLERPKDEEYRIGNLRFADSRERSTRKAILFREPLGLSWPEEYVSVPISFERGKVRRASIRVIDGASGTEVPFQLSNVQHSSSDFVLSCAVTLSVSLNPFERKAYVVFGDQREGFVAPVYDTDLKTETHEQTGQTILSNSLVSLRLPPAASTKAQAVEACPAPIIAVRGPDKVWFGDGTMRGARTVESVTCGETESGPLFKEFRIAYNLGEVKGAKPEESKPAATYEVFVRLRAKCGYAFIRERMIGDADLAFRLSWYANLRPDTAVLVRDGVAAFQPLSDVFSKESTTLAVFRAWNPPGVRNSHNWYGAWSSGDRKDAIGLVQMNGPGWAFRDRDLWVDGSWLSRTTDDKEVRLVATRAPDLAVEFPFREGTREFALAVFDKSDNWDAKTMGAPAGLTKSHVLNRLHMTLSQMNLPRVMAARADKAKTADYPHLLLSPQDFLTLKAVHDKDPNQIPELLRDLLSGSRSHTSMVRGHIINGVFALQRSFFGAPNDTAIAGFSGRLVDPAFVQPIVMYTSLLYDANVRSGIFSDREREVILATLAVAAAQLEQPGYWPLFAHDPEGAADRDCALAVISLLLSEHPQSTGRLIAARTVGMDRLDLAASTGGLAFDPGPTMTALNLWAETASAFENAGPSYALDSPYAWPQFIGILRGIPLLTTPPDRRFGGARLLPSIGRTRAGDREALAELGPAAAKYAQASPRLAGALTWAWNEAGSPSFATLTRHYALLHAVSAAPPEVRPAAPETGHSILLPRLGALFRTRFAAPDEGYLLVKCTDLPRYSYHNDQGSLLFYAFGSPLLLDSGSLPGREGTWAHNTVRIDSRTHKAPARLTESMSDDDDDYLGLEYKIESLSTLKEYTAFEIAAAAAKAKADGKTYEPPPGHNLDGSLTEDMLPTPDKLDPAVVVNRRILFNKSRQYLIVLDRITGKLPTDLFFNVLADDARVEGQTARFAGPFGVDLDLYAFGTQNPALSVDLDLPQQWCLRLTQPVPPPPPPKPPEKTAPEPKTGPAAGTPSTPTPKPDDKTTPDAKPAAGTPATPAAKPDEKTPPDTKPAAGTEPAKPAGTEPKPPAPAAAEKPAPPTVEYLSVLCPSRRVLPGGEGPEYAPPKVEKLPGMNALRIAYGNTVRYIFLDDKDTRYEGGGVKFAGKRAVLTIRPTHITVVLIDAGELVYNGRGVRTTNGFVRLTLSGQGFVDGEVLGPGEKTLTFFGLGRTHDRLSLTADSVQFLGSGTEFEVQFNVVPGNHKIAIEPR